MDMSRSSWDIEIGVRSTRLMKVCSGPAVLRSLSVVFWYEKG